MMERQFVCIGTYRTLSRARLHFGPCYWSIFLNVYLKEFFFHFGESRAMKGVILFFIFEILKRSFRKKKSLKKIKVVLRETELKTEFPIYFRQNEKKNHYVECDKGE